MATFRLVDGKLVVDLTPRERAKVAALTTAVLAAPSAPAERTFKTKAELAAGDGFPCQVDPNCKRLTRTLARSQAHATPDTLQAAGHLPKA